jgi:hypothetical protein
MGDASTEPHQPSPPRPGRTRAGGGHLRRVSGALIAALAGLLVPLVLAEIGLRLFAPQPTAVNVSQWDPDYGWRNRPGAHGFFHTHEFNMQVRINSLGLRGRETTWDKPDGTFRILGLGDSFAFGHGVDVDSCFLSLAERALDGRSRAAGGPRIEVLNTGVGKWGTAPEYLYLKREGVRFSPDAVVLAFCIDNDFANNADANVLRLEHGRLVHVQSPEPTVRKAQQITTLIPGYEFLAQHSQVVNFIRVRASVMEMKRIAAEAGQGAVAGEGLSEGPSSWSDRQLPVTLMLMDSLVAETRRDRAPLLALFIPSRWQLAPHPQPGVRGYWDPVPAAAMTDRVIAHLDSLRVPVVYPLAKLTEAARAGRVYFDEGHLNERGSRVVADALVRGLLRAGCVPAVLAPGP